MIGWRRHSLEAHFISLVRNHQKLRVSITLLMEESKIDITKSGDRVNHVELVRIVLIPGFHTVKITREGTITIGGIFFIPDGLESSFQFIEIQWIMGRRSRNEGNDTTLWNCTDTIDKSVVIYRRTALMQEETWNQWYSQLNFHMEGTQFNSRAKMAWLDSLAFTFLKKLFLFQIQTTIHIVATKTNMHRKITKTKNVPQPTATKSHQKSTVQVTKTKSEPVQQKLIKKTKSFLKLLKNQYIHILYHIRLLILMIQWPMLSKHRIRHFDWYDNIYNHHHY